jgi:adenylylsulfate kinase-like enzyme
MAGGCVLITGAYGVGKSSVAVEIAEALESRGIRYALLDLDFLCWGYTGEGEEAVERMVQANLGAVAANFRAVGVSHFILAGLVSTEREMTRIREAVGMPVRVVRIEAPWELVRSRLAQDPTGSRQIDLSHARSQIAGEAGRDVAELTVSNLGELGEAVQEVLHWLGWMDSVGDS